MKKNGLENLKAPKGLVNIQVICIMFIKMLNGTSHAKIVMY